MPTKSGKPYQPTQEPLSPLQRLGRAVRQRIDRQHKKDATPETDPLKPTDDPDTSPSGKTKVPDPGEEEGKTPDPTIKPTPTLLDFGDSKHTSELIQRAVLGSKRTTYFPEFRRNNGGKDYGHTDALEFRRLSDFVYKKLMKFPWAWRMLNGVDGYQDKDHTLNSVPEMNSHLYDTLQADLYNDLMDLCTPDAMSTIDLCMSIGGPLDLDDSPATRL